jgi:hypothetical protein
MLKVSKQTVAHCLMQFHEFAFLYRFLSSCLECFYVFFIPQHLEVILKWAPLVSHLQFGCRGLIVYQSQPMDNCHLAVDFIWRQSLELKPWITQKQFCLKIQMGGALVSKLYKNKASTRLMITCKIPQDFLLFWMKIYIASCKVMHMCQIASTQLHPGNFLNFLFFIVVFNIATFPQLPASAYKFDSSKLFPALSGSSSDKCLAATLARLTFP